jgi:tRNA threonylcarbamoyladenosine biosynthesis protein TsaB
MPSLREILAAHAPVLLLDAAGTTVHGGWLEAASPPRWQAVEEEAGAGIFRLLERLEVDLDRANAFIFCEGPGSMLGIRTSAVAIRTWQVLRPRPVFSYRSLELLAAVRGRPGVTVIADARKQSWFSLTLDPTGQPGSMVRSAPETLQAPLATPAGFRQWSPLPAAPIEAWPYDVPALWRDGAEHDLLRPSADPDAYHVEEPRYATWTPKIHQGPVPAPLKP